MLICLNRGNSADHLKRSRCGYRIIQFLVHPSIIWSVVLRELHRDAFIQETSHTGLCSPRILPFLSLTVQEYEIHKVTDHIFIGSTFSANNEKELQNLGITHIVNLGNQLKEYQNVPIGGVAHS